MPELDDLSKESMSYMRTLSTRMFTVATGALALSITFKSSLTGADPKHTWLLGLSWWSLTTSVLANLAEQYCWALYYINWMNGDVRFKIGDGASRWLRIALSTFGLGLVLLCLFGVLNNQP